MTTIHHFDNIEIKVNNRASEDDKEKKNSFQIVFNLGDVVVAHVETPILIGPLPRSISLHVVGHIYPQ